MKTIKYFFIITGALFFSGSCNKKLDVLPQQNITPDQIKTPADVEAVLNGCYKLLQSSSAFGEEYIFVPDLLAAQDQVNFVGTFTSYKDIQRKLQDKTIVQASDIWENSYTLINLTNVVLDKSNIITDQTEKDGVIATAKLFRGIAYFELVNFFGLPYSDGNASSNLGVPIRLDPVYSYDPNKDMPARATVQAVYDQAISDMNVAVAAGDYSAKAFLARVYLNMGNYTQAATMANDVIASAQFSLVPYDKAFNNDGYSPEDIFVVLQTSQSNAGTGNSGLTTFYGSQPVGRGDAQIVPSYFSHFSGNDARKDFWYNGYSISGFNGKYTTKWSTFYKSVPVVRLGEMYLTRGEANYRKGGSPIGGVSPLNDVNLIRARAAAAPLASVSGDDFVEERFRELGFEGDRLWTLKRLKMDVDGFAYNYEKLVLPIPQRETDVNSSLVQNPGY